MNRKFYFTTIFNGSLIFKVSVDTFEKKTELITKYKGKGQCLKKKVHFTITDDRKGSA